MTLTRYFKGERACMSALWKDEHKKTAGRLRANTPRRRGVLTDTHPTTTEATK